jgi:hypothetical protein
MHGRGWKAIVIATALAAPARNASAAEKAEHYPPGSTVHGLSIGEWGARWWQWCIQWPQGENPVANDTTGAFTYLGDRQRSLPGQTLAWPGDVFFLAGNFGTSTPVRTCDIPAGKEVLIPILNYANYNLPGDKYTLQELRKNCSDIIDQVSSMECSVDGEPIADIWDHREQQFAGFRFVEPEDNVFGEPAGIYEPAVSDGYYVMLRHLPAGPHEIHIRAAIGDPPTFTLDVTYELTIEEFRRGDANADGKVNLTDAIAALSWLFLGGASIACEDAADADDSGTIDLADAVVTLRYLFLGGGPLPAPGAEECGPDGTEDGLTSCPGCGCAGGA